MAKAGHFQALEVLTMSLEGEIFAVEAGAVREILDLVAATEVPGAPDFIGALLNVRGKIVPLADLRLRFGMAPTVPTIDTRVVVLEIDVDDDPTAVGILADKVYEVTQIAASAIEETPRIGMRWRPEFIRCVGKRGDDFIIVPDIARILTADVASGR